MSKTITEKEILDLAARIAIRARIDRVSRTQIENLLSAVDVSSDSKNSPWVVALYAHKQAGRGEERQGWITREMADLVYDAMSKLSEAGCGREEVRKLLGFVKWIYESFEGKERRIPPRIDVKNLTFQSALDMLKGG